MKHDLLNVEDGSSQSPAIGKNEDAENSCTEEAASSLLSAVESCKDRGNIEFHKGRALAKHTAGKSLLSDACMLYAEGIQALAKADAILARLGHQGAGVDPVSSSSRISKDETGVGTLAALCERADTVRPSLYLNLAMCNVLLQEWTAAIACCTHVLERCGDAIAAAAADSAAGGYKAGSSTQAVKDHEDTGRGDNQGDEETDRERARCRDVAAKALYRRSVAREGEGDVVAAREDLLGALRLKPDDVNVRRTLKKIEKKLADSYARERLRR